MFCLIKIVSLKSQKEEKMEVFYVVDWCVPPPPMVNNNLLSFILTPYKNRFLLFLLFPLLFPLFPFPFLSKWYISVYIDLDQESIRLKEREVSYFNKRGKLLFKVYYVVLCKKLTILYGTIFDSYYHYTGLSFINSSGKISLLYIHTEN